MKAEKGFILTPTYRVRNGVPEIHLYGVLESGQSFLAVDDRVRPYFFVRASDADTVAESESEVELEETDLVSFAGDAVVRVTVELPGDVPPLRDRLDRLGVPYYEADVRFAYRHLIDNGIRSALAISGSWVEEEPFGRVYKNPTLKPARWKHDLRVLSIDIETDPQAETIFSVALHGCGVETVLIVGDRSLQSAQELPSEKALIERFLELVREIDPDVLTGWNVIDFDLRVLLKIAHRHGLRLTIGRAKEEIEVRRDANFTRDVRATLAGRVVLDGLSLLRGAFIKLPDYRLETAAQTVLGRGKLLAGPSRAEEIERAYRQTPQLFVDYNLEDARLVTEILEKTDLVRLTVERSVLTGMPLDRVSAAIASIDSLYLASLRKRRVVAPSVGQAHRAERISGGFVMDSRPGLYVNILVFDFKSLYPSIIRTFNLDPITLVGSGRTQRDDIVAPNKARFRREPIGILPELVTALAKEREKAKKRGEQVQSHAIKILMNSMYGILGAGASRLFSPDTANAITQLGRYLIRKAASAAEALGHDVLYGDTDSLFIDPHEADADKALAAAEKTRKAIGRAVAKVIADEFACKSFLELEFEKMYHRFFLPEVRGGKVGSKKRYAGLLVDGAGNEKIEIVGLEAVRRDWSEVAKHFQRDLIDLVFHDRPVESYVRTFIADLQNGALDDELLYRKALRKSLDSYTKTTPPHVQAARKMKSLNGSIVLYTMTANGPEPAGEETAAPDYQHYIDHQIQPIADAILRFLDTDFATVADTKRQLSFGF